MILHVLCNLDVYKRKLFSLLLPFEKLCLMSSTLFPDILDTSDLVQLQLRKLIKSLVYAVLNFILTSNITMV